MSMSGLAKPSFMRDRLASNKDVFSITIPLLCVFAYLLATHGEELCKLFNQLRGYRDATAYSPLKVVSQ